ncbi:MAG TPA: MBL fold metallo-hydrolase [Propylenella sp.]|nr:MBL fold metallo-hydrolase [Propylenella sp.]
MTGRLVVIGAAFLLAWSVPGVGAAAAQEVASRCLAIAQSVPSAIAVTYIPVQERLAPVADEEVNIRFVGHSTFLITSPAGVTIATDYNGYAGMGVTPRVVTMNRAHSSHYTDAPDPGIEHVLRGWNPEGGPAEHYLELDDVLIRNVTTDIRFGGGVLADANSIFIFETARLCIGHVGHLHHVLAAEDLNWIGQLDIVMVPVDGSYTMDQDAMVETLQVVKARLILPMHYFGQATLSRFLARLGQDFEVELNGEPEITVSVATLPQSPTVLVLPGY